MNFSEEGNIINIHEFAKSFINAHTQLASKGMNYFTIKLHKNVPVQALLKRSITKRIINNFISNSLKHTQQGEVNVNF